MLQNAEDQKFRNYEDVAGGIDDLPFAVVYDADVARKVEVPLDNVVLFKQVREIELIYCKPTVLLAN